MAKSVPDAGIDGGLAYDDACNYECVCSQEPTTYTEAYTTYMLARVAMAAGDITLGNDTSGRSASMAAKNGVSITNSGTATHLALVNTGNSSLGPVTLVTSQALTAGGTVDIPAWKHNIQDPT